MTEFAAALWAYTRNPFKSDSHRLYPVKSKLIDTYTAIVIYIIIALVLAIFLGVFAKLIEYVFSINLLKIRDNNISTTVKGTYAFLILALFGPVIEETLFRLWLSLKKTHVFIALTTMSLILITKYHHASLYAFKLDKDFFYRIILALAGGSAFFLLFKMSFFRDLANKHFKLFYWMSCCGFGLIHIANFVPLKLYVLWAYPFFVLPQLVLGFILGYIRIKDGFFWALLVHCIINLPTAFIYFFK